MKNITCRIFKKESGRVIGVDEIIYVLTLENNSNTISGELNVDCNFQVPIIKEVYLNEKDEMIRVKPGRPKFFAVIPSIKPKNSITMTMILEFDMSPKIEISSGTEKIILGAKDIFSY
ncbi:MAG TPA: hypothetical protein VKP88_03800 [Candidatus Paceibacterota bacterium]|nr:hypothetical protein [Candidatus Paceibacterota bacterium]